MPADREDCSYAPLTVIHAAVELGAVHNLHEGYLDRTSRTVGDPTVGVYRPSQIEVALHRAIAFTGRRLQARPIDDGDLPVDVP